MTNEGGSAAPSGDGTPLENPNEQIQKTSISKSRILIRGMEAACPQAAASNVKDCLVLRHDGVPSPKLPGFPICDLVFGIWDFSSAHCAEQPYGVPRS